MLAVWALAPVLSHRSTTTTKSKCHRAKAAVGEFAAPFANIGVREISSLEKGFVEAESNYRDGDATSADGIKYVQEHLCFPVQEGSFEDAMGA